ncbi:MAG TPA: hypothetical protein VHV49_16650 [Pseudonocardiaceae bacterium]|jgi:hypothetical protein|nr:hypothetical protein [Pseudonocardiaceae bacterium]
MTAWSIAPWLIALLVALGLGVFGRFSDVRSRRRQDGETADAEHGSSYPEDN